MQQWYWQNLDLVPGTSGAQVWEALFSNLAVAVLLESPTQSLSKLARFSIVAGSPRQIWTPKLGEVFDCLQNLFQSNQNQSTPFPHLPFTGGWLGWLGYDLAWEIEQLPYLKPDKLPFPVAFWYEPREFAVVDHLENKIYLAASDREQLKIMTEMIANIPVKDIQPTPNLLKSNLKSEVTEQAIPSLNLSFSPDRETYQNLVREVKKHILAGDIYQANLSLRFAIDYPKSGWQVYRQLQQINPSPFACYWKTTWGEVISASPERLISLQGDRLQTRPIAGTRPRGSDLAYDLAMEQELISSLKECSEHIMLLDLERNDLGKVCNWGTVAVDEMLTIERYSHVMHLVSNVTGKLRMELNGIDGIRASFPGGTITGCPKVRCMEIIERLEPNRRSLFYGSCGYLDQRGDLDLNILIRTLLKTGGGTDIGGNRLYGQVGAGIVADSIPEQEWQESWQKAKAQLSALDYE